MVVDSVLPHAEFGRNELLFYWSSIFTMYFQIDYFSILWYRKLKSLIPLERGDSVLSFTSVLKKTSSQKIFMVAP